MNFKLSILYLISIFLVFSCKSDPATIDENLSEVGNWSIIASTRNNKPTSTLKDGYFDFGEGNVMKTNILGGEADFDYSRDGNVINQKLGPELQSAMGVDHINYIIEKLSSDTLILKSKIRNYNFEFLGIKTIE